MALGQVAARTEGDIYQGLFFWYKAANLFIQETKTLSVIFEHDAASGVDDVSVYYEPPGINDSGKVCVADHFQIKYHLSQGGEYSSEALIDPAFINAKASMLQHFFDAYKRLGNSQWYRLHLISNWHWTSYDPLARSIRSEGELPEEFFTSSSRSKLGKIREAWRLQLKVEKDEFEDFARRLRFDLDFFGRRTFQQVVNDRLGNAGLLVPPADKKLCPHIGLYISLLTDKTNEYTRDSFKLLCEAEGLIDKEHRLHAVTTIGLRSFMHGAGRMEEQTDSFVCLTKYFDGRYIKDAAHWEAFVAPEVLRFLDASKFRGKEYHIHLDCVSSLAFLAGYCLDQKSGVNCYPIQKGPNTGLWKPSEEILESWQLETEIVEINAAAVDIAVAISISNNVNADVERYLKEKALQVHSLIKIQAKGGPGQHCISCAEHAIHLAATAMTKIVSHRKKGNEMTHIFASAPNGFMYFLGRYRGPMRNVQLYEFDYEGSRGGTYETSIRLPL